MTTPQAPKTVNLQETACYIFKTVLLLERHYGADYIGRILQGFDRFGMRDESHKELETFGVMRKVYRERIGNIIKYLVKQGFLRISKPAFGNLAITPKGEAFLDAPTELVVPEKELVTPELDRMLQAELRQLRTELSEQADIMPYEIYTNYTLQKIVEEKPTNVTMLKAIPGIGDQRINRFGHAVIQAVKRVQEDGSAILLQLRAKWPSRQEVKTLFLAGKSVEEIATQRNVKPSTVITCLEELHLAGELDLTGWIENRLDPKALHKGAEYFKQVEMHDLKSAYEVLGLDYETLRMCRLYVSDVKTERTELAMAS